MGMWVKYELKEKTYSMLSSDPSFPLTDGIKVGLDEGGGSLIFSSAGECSTFGTRYGTDVVLCDETFIWLCVE